MSKTNTRLIKTTELAIGMFVAELDRPWLESSLAFKGFAIKSQSDIDLLQRNCEYVYIDMEHGSRTPEVGSEPKPKTTLDEATHHKTTSYKPPTAAEHKKAIDAYAHMEVAYKQICADVERGTRVNLNTAAKAMTHMIASLQDNPDAMLQLIMLNERQATPVSDAITTSVLATAIGHRIGTSGKALYVLAVGGLLYDVGKLTLPRELLNEPRRLTPAEFKVVKSHVEAGVRILSEAEGSNPVLVGMAQHHHERCDGTGYPAGLVQKDIPTFAKIAALVDCFNAITTHRPHAPMLSPYYAALKLFEWRNVDFDPELVEELIQVIGVYPIGSPVELSNGRVAIVVAHNSPQRLRPVVAVLLDENKQPLPHTHIMNLSAVSQDENGTPLAIKNALPCDEYNLEISGLLAQLFK